MMAFNMYTCCFLLILGLPLFYCNGSSDTLLPGQSLLSNETLVSKGGIFEMGLFSPAGNSTNYYLAIWYKNIPLRTVVKVFLRSYDPIPYSNYKDLRLHFFSNGSLCFYNCSWGYLENGSEAVILDTGNFVLRNGSGGILWQSFDHPTDTWLPGMKLYSYNYGLVSWMHPNDPVPGNYSLQADNTQLSTLFNGDKILWRSGRLQGGTFPSLPDYSTFTNSYNFTYFSDTTGFGYDDYFIYNVYNESLVSRIVIDYLGVLRHFGWSEARQSWIVLSTNDEHTMYNNTICKANYSPACRCLDGFVPRVIHEWVLSNFTDGCVRSRDLQCSDDKGKTEFTNVTITQLPANAQPWNAPNGACYLACSDNCSCTAYANDTGGGCLLFMGDLLSLETPPNNSVGVHLFLKTESESAHAHKQVLAVAIIVPITAAVIIFCFCFCYIWAKLKNKESGVTNQNLLLLDFKSNRPVYRNAEEKDNQYEFPIFSFSSIAASTNNFSVTNKLGQGGFGPVYKGELLNGQSVAVKRLSRRSGQGLEEFKNETELIAKLQHRNLVGILGCCTENDEMILVYEYMSNKSLDVFLFEPTKKEVLDWKRRVHIISGIAQGLLYLHQYSRLRIVHRDLKASNILLDAEMSPKISDFGMARIFGGNELQANTKRIVGTYGYMSPEYAMEGLFSVKSDVFAFGVLMLEIISGKKNSGFYGSDHLSLLRYAWNLWKNDSSDELIDPVLDMSDSSSSILALRYIQISLLCVEENPADRPLISEVVGMLSNEKKAIASPLNPAFIVGRSLAKPTPTQHKVEICSVNDLTVSDVGGR
ncbi:hypothetical protein C2S53_008890 [Perilla frutescens var. hirtella]|uniref:Receptor-like serine/threonine-protein kinase n=1 Tax=Perilla frutescens var. hirtella TaxID=608512 RepID=A0AAD4J3Y5_PERFH|nr:hypothetical protein C2S53_008890 [Perilla frutescens var. hirtella]